MRYADDLLLYAGSWQELWEMMESLVTELASVGLSLNTGKTKMFTTEPVDTAMFVDVAGGMV